MRALPALPRKIWVGTNEVALALVAADDPELEDDEAPPEEGQQYCRGTTECVDPPKIWISRELSPAQMVEVVWHEIEHVINWLHDIEDGSSEERSTDVHGKIWPLVLLSNPKLQRWLTYHLNAIRKEQGHA